MYYCSKKHSESFHSARIYHRNPHELIFAIHLFEDDIEVFLFVLCRCILNSKPHTKKKLEDLNFI